MKLQCGGIYVLTRLIEHHSLFALSMSTPQQVESTATVTATQGEIEQYIAAQLAAKDAERMRLFDEELTKRDAERAAQFQARAQKLFDEQMAVKEAERLRELTEHTQRLRDEQQAERNRWQEHLTALERHEQARAAQNAEAQRRFDQQAALLVQLQYVSNSLINHY